MSLEPNGITDDSFTNIRECLNALEELSLGTPGFDPKTFHYTHYGPISFTGFLELKAIPSLRILNLHYNKDEGKEIQNLRRHLPHLMVKGALWLLNREIFARKYNLNLMHKEKEPCKPVWFYLEMDQKCPEINCYLLLLHYVPPKIFCTKNQALQTCI